MTRRTSDRARRLAAGLLAAALAVTADPASARAREPMSVRENQTVERRFPAMGAGASTDNRTANPHLCASAPTCDVIPLDVVLPADFDESNDFAVRIRLDWKTEQLPNDQGQANDLDLYVWDKDVGPNDGEPLARSVGTRVPEVVGLAQPTKGRYLVTVRNSSGVNDGYTLTVTWLNGRLSSPLDTATTTPPRTGGDDTTFAPPPDAEPARPAAAPAGPVAPADPSPATAPGPVEPDLRDPDLDLERSDLDAALDEDPLVDLFAQARNTSAEGPAGPPSALTLLGWLVGVPLALVAAGAVVLRRRRPSALRLPVG